MNFAKKTHAFHKVVECSLWLDKNVVFTRVYLKVFLIVSYQISSIVGGLVEKDVRFGGDHVSRVDVYHLVVVVFVPVPRAPDIAIGRVVTALHGAHVVTNAEQKKETNIPKNDKNKAKRFAFFHLSHT